VMLLERRILGRCSATRRPYQGRRLHAGNTRVAALGITIPNGVALPADISGANCAITSARWSPVCSPSQHQTEVTRLYPAGADIDARGDGRAASRMS
jgi:hypothetical protein